jgi:hypothetical protein
MLDIIHHTGLRLALGVFRTSPVESLYAETGETSLHLRRKKLSLQLDLYLIAKIQIKIIFFKPSYMKKLLTNQRKLNH